MKNLRDLGFLELLDPTGKPVFFEEIWSKAPTVLCLTRHFGCIFCFEQAHALLGQKSEIERSGAQLVLLGNGNPADAGEFMRHFGLARGIYTDPARRLYKKLGLIHGMRTTLNWSSTKSAKRARDAGFRGAGVKGDVWQQGAVLVTAQDGQVAYLHRSQLAGDHAPLEDILDAVRGLDAARAGTGTTE